ncbi:MAG: hypothetical protein K8F36_00175 [Melioribacteraceae bacterium]|nr:hypothetical protein [Melioribacteraceae bacterium]
MINNKNLLAALFFILSASFLCAQVKIIEAPPENYSVFDSVFFDQSSKRVAIPFNTDWKVYEAETPESAVNVVVPSVFEGTTEMVYEKTFSLTDQQIIEYKHKLNFLGINYSTEILLNEVVIYKHPGGTIPFNVELNKDLLIFGGKNKLVVKIGHALDSESTIPVNQRFLFPRNLGGIFRPVYLSLIPENGIRNFVHSISLNEKNDRAAVTFNSEVTFSFFDDSLSGSDKSRSFVKTYLFSPNGSIIDSSDYLVNSSGDVEKSFVIQNPLLWSPKTPAIYKVVQKLFRNDILYDELIRDFAIYKLLPDDNGYRLNNNVFHFKGTAYFFNKPESGNLLTLKQIEDDFIKIKELGFNSIRFPKSVPHPYALKVCEKLGLFAFIEVPINSIPDEFASSESFEIRAVGFLKNMIEYYADFKSVVAIGLGASYIGTSVSQLDFVNKLGRLVKDQSSLFTYASFVNLPEKELHNVDLIGLEIFADETEEFKHKIESGFNYNAQNKIFISEATYPTFKRSTNGYLNKFSFEGQAKFFEDIIEISENTGISGFFLNSFFDFSGDFASLFSGYSKNNIYHIGILDSSGNPGRLSYKVIKSHLNDGERTTIPIGSKKDDSPILFILVGVLLSIIVALLINSKRKFREDATRALVRPYNFFADIRDHRILSGIHSTILMLCLSGSFSLLLTTILTYLQSNILLDKILLSFGWVWLSETVSYLAWHPVESLLYLFLLSVSLFLIHSIVIKAASFFIKTKILFTSVFFTVVWAFLPLALLLPLEIVLHRILAAEIANLYIYGFILLFVFWLTQRMLKGIYVIFDVRASAVYFYSFLLFLVVFGGFLLYFQLSESTIYYIINSIKQYTVL